MAKKKRPPKRAVSPWNGQILSAQHEMPRVQLLVVREAQPPYIQGAVVIFVMCDRSARIARQAEKPAFLRA